MKLIVSFFIFIFFLNSFGQNYPTRKDTIHNIISTTKSDSLRLDAYLEAIGWYYVSDPDSAIYFAIKGLELAEQINSDLGRSDAYGWLAYLYEQKSQLDESMKFNLLGLETYKRTKNLVGVSVCLNNIGLIYMRLGNFPKAFEFWEKSIVISKEINYNSGLASVYGNIGFARLEQGDNQQALEFLMQSAHYNEIDSNFHGLGITYVNIGSIYTREKNYSQAIFYLEKSLAIQKKINDKVGSAGSLTNLAYLYSEQGDFEKAQTSYDQALKLCEEIDKPDIMATIYTNKAVIEVKQNNPKAAQVFIKKAVSIAHEIGYPALIRKSLNVLIRVNNELNDRALIKDCVLEILEINNKSILTNFSMLTEKEKELYFNSLSDDYETFYSYALYDSKSSADLTDKVYNSTLQNKGFLLKSSTAMRTAILSSGDSVLIQQYGDWLELKKQIAQNFATGIDDDELEEKANQLERELAKKCSEFSLQTKAQLLTWKDVQQGLKEDEAAIEFIHFEHYFDTTSKEIQIVYCALLVKPGSEHPEMIRLFNEKDLKEILGNFPGNNLSYIQTLYGTNSESKSNLYNLVWKPMEKSLEDISTVYLSPTGLLHKIAFSALSKDKNIFLCDQHTIQMQSSTGQIVLPESFLFDASSNLTLFGGIDYNSVNTKKEIWTYLEGTKEETDQIKTYLETKKWSVDYFTSHTATEERFKITASESNILHIATHGFFYAAPDETENALTADDNEQGELNFRGGENGYAKFVTNENPLMRSGIVLAGANDVWNSSQNSTQEDGVLTAQEVATIDLRKTGLVVLSACETGLGDIKGTEGVYGLQRAFKMAGVKYIIMSLWKVPDKETAEFMITFYKKLVKTKNVRRAFIETQKIMRAKYDPYYWASFVLLE